MSDYSSKELFLGHQVNESFSLTKSNDRADLSERMYREVFLAPILESLFRMGCRSRIPTMKGSTFTTAVDRIQRIDKMLKSNHMKTKHTMILLISHPKRTMISLI
ncbi:hypothetical protein G9A89_012630 [Geosiphon pyriformis]|nr:hypothetical protein G9A89_012630 [Geosiphon pyriformis]